MNQILFTAGYAGFDLDGFLWKLRFDGIEAVIDVRDSPVSRNRSFSQPSLRQFLERNAIEYFDFRELGVPLSLRQKLRAGTEIHAYFDAFRKHLPNVTAATSRLMPLLLEKRCCLVCLEKNAHECHRSVLAEWIVAKLNDALKVRHI